ncbi:fatty acid--CoA ligase [Caballeronia sordidicola]|uniref:fatty acid--CoA ligase n=1 Tax=Caballeronia sordidicola TaxID=196367 RepID=UPI0004D017EA|nr:fatty acid--CoA ligase [Caballeronia sordidicola]
MSTSQSIDPITSAYAYPLLVRQLLRSSLASCPDQQIVYRDLARFTYSQFDERISRLANALHHLGVAMGDTVVVMDWDSHRYLEMYFAVPMMGAVMMTANVRLSPDQIAYTIQHSGASVVIVHRDFLPILNKIRDQLNTVKQFILLQDSPEPSLPDSFSLEYEALLEASGTSFEFPNFDENSRATTFYTTGTTGLPKGVFFSHRQLVLHTLSVAVAFTSAAQQGRIHRDDVYMPMTPMFHVHAWGVPYVATLLGMKQVYPGRYSPEIFIDLIEREGVTFSHGVPTLLDMVLGHPRARTADFSRWKVIIGGAALPKALAEAALSRGIDVFAGYGMSETCPFLTLSQVKSASLGAGSQELELRTRTGLPIPLVELRVVDEGMQEVAHDGITMGEVVVRAPWLTQGYLHEPSASEELWSGGYLHTRDIGVLYPDGYLRIKDRLKDVIKTGGEWVSSLMIEDLICRHPSVREAAVVGVKDSLWGERPLALVVLREGLSADESLIKSHLLSYVVNGTLSKMGIPDRVLLVDSIERTSVGKINKKLLRQKYGG